jgi:hypothetical protein
MKTTMPKAIVLCLVLARSALPLGAAEPVPNRVVVAGEYMKPAISRTFEINYVGLVSAVPAGTQTLRVWMPVPQTSTAQSTPATAWPSQSAVILFSILPKRASR